MQAVAVVVSHLKGGAVFAVHDTLANLMVNNRARPLLAVSGIFVAHWEPRTASEFINSSETSWTLRFRELVGDSECSSRSLSSCINFCMGCGRPDLRATSIRLSLDQMFFSTPFFTFY